MISNSDFEKLWFLYKTEGESKGVSINAFCLSRGVNYNEFNKWFRKMHKSIVPVEIEGAPAGDFPVVQGFYALWLPKYRVGNPLDSHKE